MALIFLLFTGITLIGASSPLLTFTALFQQKEWRLDRLQEHLRQDGWFNQLFGNLRPIIVGIWLLCLLFGVFMFKYGTNYTEIVQAGIRLIIITAVGTCLLALVNILQIVKHKQRMPQWTQKAKILVGLTLIVNTLIIVCSWKAPTIQYIALIQPLLLILQPGIVIVAWLLFKPVDTYMKNRIMMRAAALRQKMTGATVIGIAGSVGKTTTKELLHHILQDLRPHTTPAHVNTEMGVANWLIKEDQKIREQKLREEDAQRITHNANVLIIEMGAYRKGEIALLCKIAQPTIGVMTALGSDHLALFGSEEAIVEANGELINALPKGGHAFIYGDNDGCKLLASKAHCPVTLTGSENLSATNIQETSQGISFVTLSSSKGHLSFSVPLHGLHNIHNALLAIGVARHLGIADERIAELLKTFKPQAHTFNVITDHGITLLDDTYNISPLSMRAALKWAAARSERPRVLLTSGLQETGAAEEQHLKDLGALARTSVERVIFTTSHGAEIFESTFGKPVEILNGMTTRIAPGSTLLAVGRMPLSTIQRLLPE